MALPRSAAFTHRVTMSAMPDEPAPTVPPAATTLGVRERHAEPGSGTSRTVFEAPPTLANMMGFVQGGFLAGMLDSTMGLAVRSLLPAGATAPTLEMKVTYLRPAKIGTLTGYGRVIQLGGTIGFLDAELRGPDGETVAIATSTVRIVRPRG
jgi:uncharacterized protein (TIGR00369 family)